MNLDSLVLSDRMHDKSDLERQFSGWRHDQSLNVVRCCINALKGCDRESSGFTCTGLRLSDCIVSLNNWKDTFTLDRGGLVKTISIDASQSFLLQSHIIKPINWFIPIWFQVFIICFLLFWSFLYFCFIFLRNLLSSIWNIGSLVKQLNQSIPVNKYKFHTCQLEES